jgi:hypothetical protein
MVSKELDIVWLHAPPFTQSDTIEGGNGKKRTRLNRTHAGHEPCHTPLNELKACY